MTALGRCMFGLGMDRRDTWHTGLPQMPSAHFGSECTRIEMEQTLALPLHKDGMQNDPGFNSFFCKCQPVSSDL